MPASNIKLKRSAVPGKIPTVGNLELGEFAVNTFDGNLYTKKDVNGNESIVTFFGSSSSDSVVTLNSFTGDGTTTTFTISRIPKNAQHVFITINGVAQHVTTYSISGTTLTFVTPPEDQDDIEVRVLDLVTTTLAVRDYNTFIYTADSDITFTGPDDNGKILEYSNAKLEVYANGVKLVDGIDYTATDGSTVTLAQEVSGTVEVVSLARAAFLENPISDSAETFTTTDVGQVADTFNAAQFRTAKYLIQMSVGDDFHATEVLLIHDGTNTYMTEYGTIVTNTSLGEFSSEISGGNVNLLVQPSQINTNVKVKRLSVTV